ncbi:FAD-dependent oxidoreductase [soil metagenome]
MKLPIIFVIDDDQQVLRAIERDLRSRYRQDYRILRANSGDEALAAVKELKQKNEVVALFLSDQRMPGISGVDFLQETKAYFPMAKRVLLTAYSDTDAAIKAINQVQLDFYLTKPWDPPEQHLYPILDDQLEEWQAAYRPPFEGIRLVGYQWSPVSHHIKDFLAGNLIPYRWLDVVTSAEARQLLELHQIEEKDLPAVIFADGTFLLKPESRAIAEKIGLNVTASNRIYDVVIIGGGPSGLAAAVYGASEGLRTLLIERRAPGGQAGTSSWIENYLGFHKGLSGAELTRRAYAQAQRLGAEFLMPQEVTEIRIQDDYKILKLGDGSEVKARSIVITTGVHYRELEAKGVENFSGAGIYYGAATTEASACKDRDVYVVGGGNSAGQAAMHLSSFATNVYILIRSEDLSASMSQYLIDQIKATTSITLRPKTVVTEVRGNGRLEQLVLQNVDTLQPEEVEAQSLFIFIGAKPCTDTITLDFIKNDKGFIETGRDLLRYDSFKKQWKLNREPLLLESNFPGIFAAGDVRAGAMNRIASAVGEGAMAIKLVHEYLAEL